MKRQWKLAVVLSVVAVLGLAIVAAASGAAKVERSYRSGACATLVSDPEVRAAMQDLRVEHRANMQAWFEKYGADRSSTEAQSALRSLRVDHWNDMRALLEKSGVAVPEGAGPGACGGGRAAGNGPGGCGASGGGASQGSSFGGGMMGGGMMSGVSY
ncbi:MAG: hypothetical protein WC709_00720 [Thermoleophilia bacterium]